jgi:hypothetical protein
MLGNCQILRSHGRNTSKQDSSLLTCLIHTLGLSMLVTTTAFCWIEVGNLGSWPNNKKYGQKDKGEACQLNLHPIANHGSYMSQSQV